MFSQQGQGCLGTAVVERPFQRREVLEQLGLESVDRPDPVRRLIRTPRGEDPQPGADLVSLTKKLQTISDPGLVRFDGGIFGIRFNFAAVEQTVSVGIDHKAMMMGFAGKTHRGAPQAIERRD